MADYNKNTGRSPTILLTGGHGGTAGIAVIETIKRKYPGFDISWIGTSSAVSGSNVTSLEYKIYPDLGVNYYSIKAGKLQTKFTRYTIPLLFLIPVGFIQALLLMVRIKPKVVISFGGYSSFPVVFWSWVFRHPVILHEQTVVAGRASIASAFFAKKIALSRDSSLDYFPKNKCVVTGNPIRHEIVSIKPKTKLSILKTILIMGGSRGSEFINEAVFKIQSNLTSKYNIIHITGERDYEKYSKFSSEKYKVVSFVTPKEMPDIYEKTDIIISRSGANSVSEILSVKRPAILIPLPLTFMNEQYKNAKYAEEFGIAKVMKESEVNSDTLQSVIEKTFLNWQKIVDSVSEKASPDVGASEKLTNLITEYI